MPLPRAAPPPRSSVPAMSARPQQPPPRLVIRPEGPGDAAAIDEIVGAAFRLAARSAPPTRPGGPPGEVDLVGWLREDAGWLPELALVAEVEGELVGHVVGTRAWVGETPAVGLGPLSVVPERQRHGIGAALVRAVLARAEEAGESLVGLVGEPDYYVRFGFVPGRELAVTSTEPAYGDYFQVKTLTGVAPRGVFRFAAPFDRF